MAAAAVLILVNGAISIAFRLGLERSLAIAQPLLAVELDDELTPAPVRLNQFNAVQNTYLGTFQVLGGLGLLLGSAGLGIVVLRRVPIPRRSPWAERGTGCGHGWPFLPS